MTKWKDGSERGVRWRLVALAFLRLIRVRVVLRTRSFLQVRQQVMDRSPVHRQPTAHDAEVLVASVELAARLSVPKAMCLPRSLVLASMMLDAGYPADVRIGVRRHDGALQAHAWVESDGTVVGDRLDVASVYRPLGAWADLPEGASIGAPAAIDQHGGSARCGRC